MKCQTAVVEVKFRLKLSFCPFSWGFSQVLKLNFSDGKSAKEQISERWLQRNKALHVFRKINSFYSQIRIRW